MTQYIPVSYTHLDVYKRQIPDSGYIKNCIANRRLANSYAKVNATRLITVSYTHLDVYKRQIYNSRNYSILLNQQV